MSDRFEEVAERVRLDLDTVCALRSSPERIRRVIADALVSAHARGVEEGEAKGFRAGLLRAAEECEGYAAVVADEYDDGPHSVHADVARHLAKELREIADRDAPAAQPDPPPSARAVSNRIRAMLDEAMAEYPSLRARFAKGLKEIGGSNAGAE